MIGTQKELIVAVILHGLDKELNYSKRQPKPVVLQQAPKNVLRKLIKIFKTCRRVTWRFW